MKQQTPQNRNQGLSLSFCKCFFSQRWFQVQLSHFFPEQVKLRKTRLHSRFAWDSCSVCHHQHGNCIELDDVPPTPPLFTSASTGITSGSLHVLLKKLNPHQGKLDGINCYHPGSIHPKHLFPCCLHWNNVISWKNKASINLCSHFVAIKLGFFPLNLFKPTQSSTQHLIYFSVYCISENKGLWKKKNKIDISRRSLYLIWMSFLWGLGEGLIRELTPTSALKHFWKKETR